MKIYDAFLFFNEIDLLEIRLELMYNYVDYFIISECDSTFSGLSKPFNFEENKDRYKKYMDKIIYIKNYNSDKLDDIKNEHFSDKKIIFDNILKFYDNVKNSPETAYGQPHWCREFLHREFVALGMDKCEDDDLIIFSDLDEIPNPEKMIFDGKSYLLNQKNMIYYINTENITDKWYGAFITKYSEIKNKSLCYVRNNRQKYEIIPDCGWHLTFMGGIDKVKEKIKSWGHQEYNNEYILNNVSNNVKSNSDVLNRNIRLVDINIDDYYPKNIINIVKEKFNYLIK